MNSIKDRISEAQILLKSHGFSLVSNTENKYQIMWKKRKWLAIIDYELFEDEYCVYIAKDYRYIYRKTVKEEADIQPLINLARSAS